MITFLGREEAELGEQLARQEYMMQHSALNPEKEKDVLKIHSKEIKNIKIIWYKNILDQQTFKKVLN